MLVPAERNLLSFFFSDPGDCTQNLANKYGMVLKCYSPLLYLINC